MCRSGSTNRKQRRYALTVCTQSSHGSTSQPQSATSLTATKEVFGGENFCFTAGCVRSGLSVTASAFGIQRANGVRSATSTMYQHFLAASQRAPSALTASFSAKGVTKLILMARIICRWLDPRVKSLPIPAHPCPSPPEPTPNRLLKTPGNQGRNRRIKLAG